MENLINKDKTQIAKEITTYLEDVFRRTEERLIHLASLPIDKRSLPVVQHTVPKFILRLIAAENPAHVTQEKGLELKEHKMEYDPISRKLGDFIPSKHLVSPKTYSIRSKIYNSSTLDSEFFPVLHNEFFTEIMFSMVETDAARLIQSKAAVDYDLNDDKEYNPFYFYLPKYNPKPPKTRARAILSTFFTIQFLRAEQRKDALADLSLKYGMDSIDFAGNIRNHLFDTTIETYLRQWTWIRVPNHEMFISELGMVTAASCFGPVASIMPISRRDFIYLNENVGSHTSLDDKLVYSTSPIVYNWYFSSLLEQIFHWQKHDMSFVSNKEAVFSKSAIYKPETCCFSCLLNPIRKNPSNKLFLIS